MHARVIERLIRAKAPDSGTSVGCPCRDACPGVNRFPVSFYHSRLPDSILL